MYHSEHGSDTAVLHAKLQSDWKTAKEVMGKRDLRDFRCVSDGLHILHKAAATSKVDAI